MESPMQVIDTNVADGMLTRMRDQLKFFPQHDPEGCDCELCSCHDCLISAIAWLEIYCGIHVSQKEKGVV
jgi:hypothetical protein